VKADVKAVIAHLGTEDQWFIFRAAADTFLKAYGTLSPDPRVLPYQSDLKFVAAVLPYGRLHFEKIEETDWKKYSEKIRAMLDEHLEVTGLKTVCKLRSLTDPAFWGDFGQPEDVKIAAVRKLAELKKETSERASKNAARYDKFSDRIKALIKQFSAGLIDADKVLAETEIIAKEVLAEDEAHLGSGLNERAYGIAAILETFKGGADGVSEGPAPAYGGQGAGLSPLQQAAADIDALYTSDLSAPTYWQDKTELKKELRGQVRRIIQNLSLDGWQKQIPLEVEHYAVLHYGKP
jgi:type I restriction enzyme R subunit